MSVQETKSTAESLALLPESERKRLLDGYSDAQIEALLWDWTFWARPDQLAPPGNWTIWLVLSGRGFGKTRAGAEWIRAQVKAGKRRLALVGETQKDLEEVMIEGESGILSVCPPHERPEYRRKPVRLRWPNGAIALGYNATEPAQLRGPQFDAAWCFIAGTMVATPNGDRPIESLRPGDFVLTRDGARCVLQNSARQAVVGRVDFENGSHLIGTADHPVFVANGWRRLDSLGVGDRACVIDASNGMAAAGTAMAATKPTTNERTKAYDRSVRFDCIARSGDTISERFRRAVTSIIATATPRTTNSKIWPACQKAITCGCTTLSGLLSVLIGQRGRHVFANAQIAAASCDGAWFRRNLSADPVSFVAPRKTERSSGSARSAAPASGRGPATIAVSVASTWQRLAVRSVYCLKIAGAPEYFANGILVHNCDELAKWRYARETWDMLQFGLRLGEMPQQIVTTTPRPIAVLKELLASPDIVVTRGTTYDNRANLAPTFFRQIVRKYEGTRLGRQELNAEILEEATGALWTRKLIEDTRIGPADDLRARMKRIVVALDPAASSDEEDSAEHGIIIAGLGHDGHGYILEDLSVRGSPDTIARRAIAAYDRWQGDRIVGEVNNGGEWIGQTIAMTAKAMHREELRESPEVAYKAVHASRGKQTRAEPVSALYEQKRIHHVGALPELEDQMCTWEPLAGMASPDRIDAMVWGITELMLSGEEAMEGDEDQFVYAANSVAHLDQLPRVYGIDVKGSRVSVVWGAYDHAAETVYLYAEYVEDRARMEIWASAIKKRDKRDGVTPGIFDLKARKRTEEQGERLVDRMIDEGLDIFTDEADAEAGVDEINARIGSKQLRVAAGMTGWLGEYRALRRDKKGDLVQENDGLLKATGLLLVSGLSIATVGNAVAEEMEVVTRNRRTGY